MSIFEEKYILFIICKAKVIHKTKNLCRGPLSWGRGRHPQAWGPGPWQKGLGPLETGSGDGALSILKEPVGL